MDQNDTVTLDRLEEAEREVRVARDPEDDPCLNRLLDRTLDRVWIATGTATLTPTTVWCAEFTGRR